MEACATAHHWARELIALGHEVKLRVCAMLNGWPVLSKRTVPRCRSLRGRFFGSSWRS
jgi:hypothetical protein